MSSVPKRVIWMQDEDTLKWVLVGLSADGGIQDPRDYEDVRAPLPNQPSGRVWARDDDTGRWINVRAEASKEETARAEAALRRAQAAAVAAQEQKKQDVQVQQWKPARFTPRHARRRESPRSSLSSVHQNYALRLSGQKEAFEVAQTPIAEEDSVTSDGDDSGARYHKVRPGDTFNFICLKYKISADALRAANNFSGSTLKGAPKKLIIPSPVSSPTASKDASRDASRNANVEGSPSAEGSAKEGEKKLVKKETDPTEENTPGENTPVPSVTSSADTERPAPHSDPPRRQSTPGTGYAPATEHQPPTKYQAPTDYRAPPTEYHTPPKIVAEEKEEVQYHWVEPDDSLRWICLKYKVNANDLRRANNFTGSNLKIAPKKLIIPKPSKSSAAKARSYRRNRTDGGSSVSGSSARGGLSLGGATSNRDDDSVGHSSFFSSNSRSSRRSRDVSETYVPRGVYVPKGSNGTAGGSVDGAPLGGAASHANDDVSVMTTGTYAAPPQVIVHMPDVQKLGLHDAHHSDSDSSDSEAGGESSHKGPRYHDVRPSDTIEYLCMRYRVSATALRRANIGLTGRNLQTGPKRLIIPSNTTTNPSSFGYHKKLTKDTCDTVTCTTFQTYSVDETNTLAMSDGLSDGPLTLAEQCATVDMHPDGEDGQDVLYHEVQPSDTLQGLCLLYGVTAYELRRANNFRGLNLSTAPERLVIPQQSGRNRSTKGFKNMTEDEKIQTLIAHLPTSRQTNKPLLSHEEARAYLEFNDWNFDQALRNAKVDSDWSSRRKSSQAR